MPHFLGSLWETLVPWLVAAMVAWVPPTHPATDMPRYESIARDDLDVAFDAAEAPLFSGPHGREKTALLIAAVESLESQYRADVDDGRVRGALGEVGLVQVLLPSPHHRIVLTASTYTYSLVDGWSYDDLLADRQKCIRVAVHKLRESLRACKDLSLYTQGRCDTDEPKAKHRLGRAEGWWRHAPAPMTDAENMMVPPT